SAAGAVLTIQRGAHANSALEETPPPGSGVAVTVQIGDDGILDEANVSTVSPTTPGGRIEGQLTIGAGSVTVTDDEMALVLTVPTGFDLSGFANGDEVLATFSQGADGSLSLTALSRDDAEHDDAAPRAAPAARVRTAAAAARTPAAARTAAAARTPAAARTAAAARPAAARA